MSLSHMRTCNGRGDLGFGSKERDKDQSTSLAPAQLAWILLSDVAIDRAWELVYQIPSILHSLFIHIDHPNPFLRGRSRKMLLQTLRAWLPGLDEQLGEGTSTTAGKELVDQLTDSTDLIFWSDGDPDDPVIRRSSSLASAVIRLLEPLVPSLRQDWATLALDWGTSCPVRAAASKSLKMFRVLGPEIDKPLIASLIGRLSNTVSDEDVHIRQFGSELINTLKTVASSKRLPPSLLPLMFWCKSITNRFLL